MYRHADPIVAAPPTNNAAVLRIAKYPNYGRRVAEWNLKTYDTEFAALVAATPGFVTNAPATVLEIARRHSNRSATTTFD